MSSFSKKAFIDYWRLAGAFHRGDIVARIDLRTGRLDNVYGIVTSVLRATGHADVEWPWGNERVSVDELSRINPREMEFLPTYIDTSYAGWDISKSRNDDATEYHYNYALPRLASSDSICGDVHPEEYDEHALGHTPWRELTHCILRKGHPGPHEASPDVRWKNKNLSHTPSDKILARVALGGMAAKLADNYQKISNHVLYAATVKRHNGLTDLQAYETLSARYPSVPDHQIRNAVDQVYSLVWLKVASKCNCENMVCEKKPGGHVAGSCKKPAGKARIQDLGPVCDDCAKTYPTKYHVASQPKPNNDAEQLIQNMLGDEFHSNDMYDALQVTAPLRGAEWWARDTANDAYLDYRIPNFDQYKYAEEVNRSFHGLVRYAEAPPGLTFEVCAAEESPKNAKPIESFDDPSEAVDAAAKALDKNAYACVNIKSGDKQLGHVDVWDSRNKWFALEQVKKAVRHVSKRLPTASIPDPAPKFVFKILIQQTKL